jgi:predicted nucleic acid-binding Zn finger protein
MTTAAIGRMEVVTPKNGRTYTVIEVPSGSNPSLFYRVDVVNGRCSCKGWTMHANKDGSRNTCKHLRQLGFRD